MISETDALLFLDLDKDRSRNDAAFRRIHNDTRLKPAWTQFQALRALAMEGAPQPGEKLVRSVLEECKRGDVGRSLSRITGDDAAREILLGAGTRIKSAWLVAAALLASLALAWGTLRVLSGPGDDGVGSGATQGAVPDPGPGAVQAVPFEFPVQTPPIAAALASPDDEAVPGDADDVHVESAVDLQASRLLRDDLRNADSAARTDATTAPKARDAKNPGVPASLSLSSDHLWAQASGASPSVEAETNMGPLDVALGMPERSAIDVRLFSQSGKTARVLAAGAFGPGTQHFSLEAKDDRGRALEPGTYYLRVMTPWFSRVEPIQIH